MKSHRTHLIPFILIAIIAIVINIMMIGTELPDIQFHDTFISLDKTSINLIIIGPLTFLLFLFIGIVSGFKNFISNSGLIVGIVLISIINLSIIISLIDFRDQFISNEQFENKDLIIDRFGTKIIISKVVFGVFITGLGLLCYRTIMLLKHKNTSANKL